MNPSQQDEADASWLKLAAARRQALESAAAAEFPPPPGFATRVVALAMAARRDTAISRWTLWSFRGALASAAAAVLVVAAAPATARPPGRGTGTEPMLLRAPAMEIPAIGPL